MNQHNTLTRSIRIIEVALYKAVEALNNCCEYQLRDITVQEFMILACEELDIDPDGFKWIRLDE